MKYFLLCLFIAVPALAHVPVITPSDKPTGDRPPVIEPRPLPPVFVSPFIML